MSFRKITLLSLLVVFALGLVAPVAALASGGGSSAGDQQYVDPLSGNSGNSGSSSSGSSNSGSSSSGSSSSGSSGTVSSSTGSTGSTGTVSSSSTGTTAATTATGKLPFTGFDVPVAIAIGVTLIGAGFLLRRRILRA